MRSLCSLCEAQTTNCECAFGNGASEQLLGGSVVPSDLYTAPNDKCTQRAGRASVLGRESCHSLNALPGHPVLWRLKRALAVSAGRNCSSASSMSVTAY